MKSSRMKSDKAGELAYHLGLIDLLTLCTEGKNVFTEIKCHSLVPLDDILLIVTHQDCIPEVCVCVCVRACVLMCLRACIYAYILFGISMVFIVTRLLIIKYCDTLG